MITDAFADLAELSPETKFAKNYFEREEFLIGNSEYTNSGEVVARAQDNKFISIPAFTSAGVQNNADSIFYSTSIVPVSSFANIISENTGNILTSGEGSKEWLNQPGKTFDFSDFNIEQVSNNTDPQKPLYLTLIGANNDDKFTGVEGLLLDNQDSVLTFAGLGGNDYIDLTKKDKTDNAPKLVVYGDAVEGQSNAESQIFLDYFDFDPNTSPGGDDTIKINALSAAEVYAGPGDDVVIVDGVTPQFGANGDITGFVLPEGTVLDGGDGTDMLVLQLSEDLPPDTITQLSPEVLASLNATGFESIRIGSQQYLPEVERFYDDTRFSTEAVIFNFDDVGERVGDYLVTGLSNALPAGYTSPQAAVLIGNSNMQTNLNTIPGETYTVTLAFQGVTVEQGSTVHPAANSVTIEIGDQKFDIEVPAGGWQEVSLAFNATSDRTRFKAYINSAEDSQAVAVVTPDHINFAPTLELEPLVTSLVYDPAQPVTEEIKIAEIEMSDLDNLGLNRLILEGGNPNLFRISYEAEGIFLVLEEDADIEPGMTLEYAIGVTDQGYDGALSDRVSGAIAVVSVDDQAPIDGQEPNDGSDDGDNTEASPSVPTATGDPMVPLFDEAGYLAANPDVAAAVEAGTVASGLAHFITFGLSEGRDPFELFDTAYYLEQYPDVAAAIEAGAIGSAFEHYIQFGQFENRNPSVLFHATDYLTANPDVAAAVEAGTIASAFEHYVTFGATEGRNLNVA